MEKSEDRRRSSNICHRTPDIGQKGMRMLRCERWVCEELGRYRLDENSNIKVENWKNRKTEDGVQTSVTGHRTPDKRGMRTLCCERWVCEKINIGKIRRPKTEDGVQTSVTGHRTPDKKVWGRYAVRGESVRKSILEKSGDRRPKLEVHREPTNLNTGHLSSDTGHRTKRYDDATLWEVSLWGARKLRVKRK